MAEMPGRPADELERIIAEARRLVAAQRRALAHADFAGLLAAASAFHQLAARLGALEISPPPPLRADLLALRQEILCQGQLLARIHATASHPRAYAPRTGAPTGSSLLLDHYT
ncbi:MAG: hypothetical protein IRY83_06270 [Chloroflexi bacterium]|nr:hypothetical protein [Chloroflexota bacterium]